MPTVFVSRKERFNAAHKLYNPKWSPEKNCEVFGVCANEYYHGHNFELIVTVSGTPDPDTGFVVDMKRLGKLIKELIINKVDHHNLNMDVDFMKGILPSCENFVFKIWEILEEPVTTLGTNNNAKLHCIKLYETMNNYVEYYGE